MALGVHAAGCSASSRFTRPVSCTSPCYPTLAQAERAQVEEETHFANTTLEACPFLKLIAGGTPFSELVVNRENPKGEPG